MRNHEVLEVWRKAHQLTVAIYRATENFPRSEIFGLRSQIRRAAGSIGANLAEGCGRWSDTELARYVQIAMGSASELQNHLRLASDLEFLREPDGSRLMKQLKWRSADADRFPAESARDSHPEENTDDSLWRIANSEKRRAIAVLPPVTAAC